MRFAVACLLVAIALGRASAMAQAAGDSMDGLRKCSTLSDAERTKCLDMLSRETGQESWVVSETRSPIDYSPIVVAAAMARGAADGMKLSIACRGGTTSVVLGGPGALPAGGGYTVSYAIDGGPSRTLAAVAANSGTAMALSGDVVGFLVSLPPQGEIAFRIAGRQDVTLVEGHYSLAGLKTTRERMAVSCKWPPR